MPKTNFSSINAKSVQAFAVRGKIEVQLSLEVRTISLYGVKQEMQFIVLAITAWKDSFCAL